jgi:hypothetical protein
LHAERAGGFAAARLRGLAFFRSYVLRHLAYEGFDSPLFSVAHDRQRELAADRCRRDEAREVVHGFYFVAACRGDHVALLDAGLGGRAVRGHRRDQRTGRVVGVESKALHDRGLTF